MSDPDDPAGLGTRHLRFERRGPVAWCTVDRPEARNALTPAMYRGIGRAVEIVAASSELLALVVTGTGDVFVPGGDVGHGPGEGDFESGASDFLPFAALRDSPVPVVAAVNGHCHASGVLIALLADVAVASDRATFRTPELLRGFPEVWTAAVLPAHVGVGRANDLMLTGRRLDAQEARSIGLVARVAPHERLVEVASEVAYELLEAAPAARRTWRNALATHYGPVDEALMARAADAPEAVEGFAAFLARRAPSWSPRDEAPSI